MGKSVDVARYPIFTDRRRESDEHEEPKGEQHVDTRETVSVVYWITDTGSKGYPLFRFGMGREGG